MGIEVEQPGIDRLPLDTRADGAWLHAEWLRYVAPQLGMETSKLILGDVLDNIIGDDRNYFAWGKTMYLDPEIGEESRKGLLERLEWEISTPELPDEIRQRLVEVKKTIEPLDWKKQELFEKARETWYSARDWIKERIDQTSELREAFDYYIEMSHILGELELYDEFWSQRKQLVSKKA